MQEAFLDNLLSTLSQVPCDVQHAQCLIDPNKQSTSLLASSMQMGKSSYWLDVYSRCTRTCGESKFEFWNCWRGNCLLHKAWLGVWTKAAPYATHDESQTISRLRRQFQVQSNLHQANMVQNRKVPLSGNIPQEEQHLHKIPRSCLIAQPSLRGHVLSLDFPLTEFCVSLAMGIIAFPDQALWRDCVKTCHLCFFSILLQYQHVFDLAFWTAFCLLKSRFCSQVESSEQLMPTIVQRWSMSACYGSCWSV